LHIEHSGICTSCHNDEFYSHRAEGGRTGRFAVVAYLGPASSSASMQPAGLSLASRSSGSAREPVSLHPSGLPPFSHELPDAPADDRANRATTAGER
jgi:hypothetical protein